MRINVYPICSKLHDEEFISASTQEFLNALGQELETTINVVSSVEELYDSDIPLIFVQTGGSEGLFLKEYPSINEPIYLLTSGSANSLAASIEILSYLKNIDVKAEILHGSSSYIASRIKEIISGAVIYKPVRLGIIGKPSDWLIASNVNYGEVNRIFGIELVDVPLNDLVEEYASSKLEDFDSNYEFKDYPQEEIDKAKRVYVAIKTIMKSRRLDGVTIRCFDLLAKIHTTSCLALSILNSEGMIGACEGDIPSMITMELIKRHLGLSSFQCNPSRINVEKNSLVLAHCALPLDMCESYSLDSHYESGIGVGIRGKLKTQDITIFKVGSDLKTFFVSEGKLIQNLSEDNLCRTQIEIVLDEDVSYFLKRPCGNHHIVIYGHHKKAIEALMNNYL